LTNNCIGFRGVQTIEEKEDILGVLDIVNYFLLTVLWVYFGFEKTDIANLFVQYKRRAVELIDPINRRLVGGGAINYPVTDIGSQHIPIKLYPHLAGVIGREFVSSDNVLFINCLVVGQNVGDFNC
jgi:hypothetical protein